MTASGGSATGAQRDGRSRSLVTRSGTGASPPFLAQRSVQVGPGREDLLEHLVLVAQRLVLGAESADLGECLLPDLLRRARHGAGEQPERLAELRDHLAAGRPAIGGL